MSKLEEVYGDPISICVVGKHIYVGWTKEELEEKANAPGNSYGALPPENGDHDVTILFSVRDIYEYTKAFPRFQMPFLVDMLVAYFRGGNSDHSRIFVRHGLNKE